MELKSLFNAILLFFSSFRDNVSQTDNSGIYFVDVQILLKSPFIMT